MIYNMADLKIKMAPLPFLLLRHLLLPAGEHLDQAERAKPAPLHHSQHLHENQYVFHVLAGALDTGTAETVKGSVPARLSRLCLSSSQHWRFIFMHTRSSHALE